MTFFAQRPCSPGKFRIRTNPKPNRNPIPNFITTLTLTIQTLSCP